MAQTTELALRAFILDYFNKRGLTSSADAFRADLIRKGDNHQALKPPIDSPTAFLFDWFGLFWGVFDSRLTRAHKNINQASNSNINANRITLSRNVRNNNINNTNSINENKNHADSLKGNVDKSTNDASNNPANINLGIKDPEQGNIETNPNVNPSRSSQRLPHSVPRQFSQSVGRPQLSQSNVPSDHVNQPPQNSLHSAQKFQQQSNSSLHPQHQSESHSQSNHSPSMKQPNHPTHIQKPDQSSQQMHAPQMTALNHSLHHPPQPRALPTTHHMSRFPSRSSDLSFQQQQTQQFRKHQLENQNHPKSSNGRITSNHYNPNAQDMNIHVVRPNNPNNSQSMMNAPNNNHIRSLQSNGTDPMIPPHSFTLRNNASHSQTLSDVQLQHGQNQQNRIVQSEQPVFNTRRTLDGQNGPDHPQPSSTMPLVNSFQKIDIPADQLSNPNLSSSMIGNEPIDTILSFVGNHAVSRESGGSSIGAAAATPVSSKNHNLKQTKHSGNKPLPHSVTGSNLVPSHSQEILTKSRARMNVENESEASKRGSMDLSNAQGIYDNATQDESTPRVGSSKRRLNRNLVGSSGMQSPHSSFAPFTEGRGPLKRQRPASDGYSDGIQPSTVTESLNQARQSVDQQQVQMVQQGIHQNHQSLSPRQQSGKSINHLSPPQQQTQQMRQPQKHQTQQQRQQQQHQQQHQQHHQQQKQVHQPSEQAQQTPAQRFPRKQQQSTPLSANDVNQMARVTQPLHMHPQNPASVQIGNQSKRNGQLGINHQQNTNVINVNDKIAIHCPPSSNRHLPQAHYTVPEHVMKGKHDNITSAQPRRKPNTSSDLPSTDIKGFDGKRDSGYRFNDGSFVLNDGAGRNTNPRQEDPLMNQNTSSMQVNGPDANRNVAYMGFLPDATIAAVGGNGKKETLNGIESREDAGNGSKTRGNPSSGREKMFDERAGPERIPGDPTHFKNELLKSKEDVRHIQALVSNEMLKNTGSMRMGSNDLDMGRNELKPRVRNSAKSSNSRDNVRGSSWNNGVPNNQVIRDVTKVKIDGPNLSVADGDEDRIEPNDKSTEDIDGGNRSTKSDRPSSQNRSGGTPSQRSAASGVSGVADRGNQVASSASGARQQRKRNSTARGGGQGRKRAAGVGRGVRGKGSKGSRSNAEDGGGSTGGRQTKGLGQGDIVEPNHTPEAVVDERLRENNNQRVKRGDGGFFDDGANNPSQLLGIFSSSDGNDKSSAPNGGNYGYDVAQMAQYLTPDVEDGEIGMLTMAEDLEGVDSVGIGATTADFEENLLDVN